MKEIDAHGSPLQARDASVGLIDILLRQNRLDEANDFIRLMRGRYPDMFENDYQAAVLALRVAHARKDKTVWRSALDLATTLAGQRKIPVKLLTLP